jgi:hypothetical protein
MFVLCSQGATILVMNVRTFMDNPCCLRQGRLSEGGISTVDLVIKLACLVLKVNNIFYIKAADLN